MSRAVRVPRLTFPPWKRSFAQTPKRRMKTILVLAGTALLLAGIAYAGPEVIIRERAKELRDQNNVRQGVAPPTQAAQPAAAPSAPAPSPAITRFQADLAAIKTGSPPTAEQNQKLTQDLLAAAQSAKPSPAAAKKLAEALAAAAMDKPLPATSRARLAQELDAVLNPGKYPSAKLEGIFADVQAIFQENGLLRKGAVAIADDVKAISAEIQAGGAK
jgi:hypothetical protein